MSHVWASIASKAPCARRAQAKPLLELFNGYARYQGRHFGNRCAASAWSKQQRCIEQEKATATSKRTFSATTFLAARASRPPPARKGARPETAAKVEPAQTVASHTEGTLSQADEEGISWRDYDPEAGMPLPQGELAQPQINGVFGSEEMDADTGNYILCVMYWRRQSGALIDTGLDFPRRSGVSREQALRGLEYVRSLDLDFDEQRAGEVWVEEESLRLQAEVKERAQKLGIYKRDPEEYDEEEEAQQGTPQGESVLRTHRQEREAAWEREKAETAARKTQQESSALHSSRGPLQLAGGVQPTVALTTTGPTGVTITGAPKSIWLTSVERKPWVKYYEEQANLIKDNILPQLTLLGRLGPSFLMTLAVLGLAYFISENYTPPPKSARIWPDTPPAVATLGALTAVLGCTFLLARLPPFWKTLQKYFTVVPALPNAWSMLGSTFRHDHLTHLAFNLAFLWPFGLALHEDVGRGTFLAIYFATGALGGFSSLAYQVLRKEWRAYAFGNSAAVFGVMAAFCGIRPDGMLRFAGIELPFAAWVLVPLFAGAEIWALARGVRLGVDHAGHLGGMVAGLAVAAAFRWKMAGQREGEVLMVAREVPHEEAKTG